jgi:threonine synthase
VDHVLARHLSLAGASPPDTGSNNPFIRYRERLHSWQRARAGGMSDAAFVALVERLDEAVKAGEGCGFQITPFGEAPGLGAALGFEPGGGVWVKDETRNVSGSHKARHLFGIALHLEVSEALGLTPPTPPRLAIASCGNAALAAAVVARALGRKLDVFVPSRAEAPVRKRLAALRADIHACERTEGISGDPCYQAFHRALGEGALPFSCQGPDNGLTIEGGETLGLEVVSAMRAEGAPLDRWFVQVGGGALASACIQALKQSLALGALPSLPRLHAVQTRGAFPLRRAWERFVDVLAGPGTSKAFPEASPGDDFRTAEAARDAVRAGKLEAARRYAATHRSEFMRPWESEPRSVAEGILDDETYDWLELCVGMCETGGWPLVVSEESLLDAHRLAHAASTCRPSHTGSAGLAGLIDLRRAGAVGPGERVAVLFTGVER